MTDMVLEEVRRAVANCIPGDDVLRIRSVAARISARIGREKISPEVVEQHLLEAGVAAGIPIELERHPARSG